jgi:hypothetical protein
MDRVDGATPNVGRLRRIARHLFKDDGGIERDDELLKAKRRIIYAIDASEVFSYVFLTKLSYFTDSSSREYVLNVGFNEMVLHELLLSGRYNLFMLPSHRLELRQLIETIHERELSELGQMFTALYENLGLRESLISALEKFDAAGDGIPIDSALATQIVSEASLDAPSVLLLARVESARPRNRLRHLRTRMNLSPLELLLKKPIHLQIDETVTSEAAEEFNKRRPSVREISNNKIDAYALSHLTDLIAKSPPNTEVRLVTRSLIFEDVSRALASRGVIPREVANAIRHPRAFSAYVLARSTERSTADVVHQRLSAAGTFLSALRELGPKLLSDILKHSPTALIARSANTLAATVQELERIAMLSSVSEVDSSPSDTYPAFHTNISQLVRLLRDHVGVRQAVQTRAQEVVDRLSANTINIARSLAVSLVPDDDDTVSALEVDFQSQKARLPGKPATAITVTRLESSPAPFSISFYSEFFPQMLEKGEKPYSVLSQFVGSLEFDSPFERRLATAYLLGLNNDWELSFQFANAALDEPLTGDSTPRHEGHYFRAIARRHSHSWDIDNIKASLEDVNQAQQISSTIYGPSEGNDLRYMNERALLIDQAVRAGLSKELLAALGVTEDPIDLWQRILREGAPLGYKLNAANNITFFYLQTRDKTKTAESLEVLNALIEDNKFQVSDLPLSVQDTVLSARLLTDYYADPAEIEAAKAELARINEDSYVRKRPILHKS